MAEGDFRDGAAGRPLGNDADSFARNDHGAGATHRRNMQALEERTMGSLGGGSGGTGASGALTFKGCLAGIALLIGLPLAAYIVIGLGVVLYDEHERRSRSSFGEPAPRPVCTETAPPCSPNEMYKDVVTGSLHPHPPKTLEEQAMMRRASRVPAPGPQVGPTKRLPMKSKSKASPGQRVSGPDRGELIGAAPR